MKTELKIRKDESGRVQVEADPEVLANVETGENPLTALVNAVDFEGKTATITVETEPMCYSDFLAIALTKHMNQ